MTGKTFGEARSSLIGLNVHFSFKGPDGVEYDSAPDSVKITGTDPADGSPIPEGKGLVLVVDKTKSAADAAAASASASAAAARASASASAAAAARATRYDYRCSTEDSAITAKNVQHFNSPQAIWAAPNFAQLQSCDLYVGGKWWRDRFSLEPDEQSAVNQLAADGGDASIPSGALGDILMACALPPTEGWDNSRGVRVRVQAIAKAALRMCGNAPFAADLQRVADGIPPATFTDGTYRVGVDIQAGTYQIQGGSVRNCYWERTTGQGGTIANDFITFAPNGPVVTVYPGEGFVSERCGTWKKIG